MGGRWKGLSGVGVADWELVVGNASDHLNNLLITGWLLYIMQVIALKSMGHHGVGGGCIGDIVKMVDSINVSNCEGQETVGSVWRAQGG